MKFSARNAANSSPVRRGNPIALEKVMNRTATALIWPNYKDFLHRILPWLMTALILADLF